MFWPRRAKKKPNDDQPRDELAVWMDPVEFSQVLAIVHTAGPRRFLEWGAGGSTRALLSRCPFIERYLAIEHDETWGRKVRALVTDPRLEVRLVPPDKPFTMPSPTREQVIAWEESAEHDESIFETYVRGAGSEVFDVVMVDGRARRYCILRGFELLRPGGVLFVHDAQRPTYHDALGEIGQPLFLEPWRQGQVALVRKADR